MKNTERVSIEEYVEEPKTTREKGDLEIQESPLAEKARGNLDARRTGPVIMGL